MKQLCNWIRAFDVHFNISCPSKLRANGDFKSDNLREGKWEFIYCPYCGRKITILYESDYEKN